MDQQSVAFYKDNWWMYLILGLATLMFGFVAIINPAQTFLTLVFFFGLLLLINGVITIIIGLTSGRVRRSWIVSLLLGALEAGIGIYLLQRPQLALATFVIYAAIALMVNGIVHLVEAFDAQYDGVFRVWQVIASVVSFLAAIVIWRYPVQGTLAFVWVLGVYAIINGPLMIAFSLEAKKGFKKLPAGK